MNKSYSYIRRVIDIELYEVGYRLVIESYEVGCRLVIQLREVSYRHNPPAGKAFTTSFIDSIAIVELHFSAV